jgi:F-type H+-transporting ATPase subunit b
MRALRLLLVVIALGVPSLALAEDHEAEGHGEAAAHEIAERAEGHGEHADGHGELTFTGVLTNMEFIGAVVNFVALLLLLGWIIKTKGNPALAEKRKQVEQELAEAQRLRAEAEQRHMATQTRLERLDQEMVSLRGEMIKAGEVERDRIVAAAEEKAARLRNDTRFLIEQQIKQLRQDLTREASSAAVEAAQQLLSQSTTDEDQDRLAEAYLTRLDEVIEENRS